MFNRCKLGRTLDEAYADGYNLWFEELALSICVQDGSDLRFNRLDTTSFAVTGEHVPDREEYAIRATHGYAKDHRPDLKQAVLELSLSHGGGVPFVSKSWAGNTADTQVFQKWAEALMRAFKDAPSPSYLVAVAKLYGADNVAHLAKLGFITRLPAPLKLVSQVIAQALRSNTWPSFDNHTRYPSLALCYDGMAQRGRVVS